MTKKKVATKKKPVKKEAQKVSLKKAVKNEKAPTKAKVQTVKLTVAELADHLKNATMEGMKMALATIFQMGAGLPAVKNISKEPNIQPTNEIVTREEISESDF